METYRSATARSSSHAREDIAAALAQLARMKSERFASSERSKRFGNVKRPKLKPLVLLAAPNARVRRAQASRRFDCYIGDRLVRSPDCGGCGHSTPDGAWMCLARFILSPAFNRHTGAPQ